MSGSNPFRRKGPGAGTIGSSSGRANEDDESISKPPASNATNVGISASQDDDARTQARPQKTVRIASPPVPEPVSPPLERRSSAGRYTTFKGQDIRHRGSPPPLARNPSRDEISNNDAADPFDSEGLDSESDEESANTGHSDGRNSATIGGEAQSGLSDKASSDSELRDGVQASYRGSPSGDDASTYPALSSGTQLSRKSTLDVDAFKRLLLTGDSGQEAGQASTTEAPGHAGEEQRKADRKPVSDDASEAHHDGHTDLSSHDRISSLTDDARKNTLEQAGSAEKEKMKPPPPKTRHGKLIQKGDEAGLDSTSSSLGPSNVPSSRSTSTSTTSPSIHVEPQPDKQTPHSVIETPTSSANAPRILTEQAQLSSTPTPKAKRPPTPPLTRRHSQMKRAETGVSRSNSARQPHSTGGLTSTSNLSRAASTSKNAPPPPSPRRLQGDTAAPQSSPTPPSQRRSSLNQSISGETPVSIAQQQQGDSEKSSLSGSGSVKESSATTSSRKTSGSNVPPRPPPRRRTGQPTSSSNLNYSEDPRPESIPASETNAPASTAPRGSTESESTQNARSTGGAGLLADLTQLQKEVDDLRGQYAGRRPS